MPPKKPRQSKQPLDINTIVFIDFSYYMFYRFNAYKKWLSYSKTDEEISELDWNSESVRNHFTELFIKNLKKIKKEYKVDNNMFLCMDCKRADIWRNDLIDGYKDGRTCQALPYELFTYIIDIVKNKEQFKMIRIECLEADDVIALYIKKYCDSNINSDINNKYVDYKKIIITNDNDYIQLFKYSNVEIYNLGGIDLNKRNKLDSPRAFLWNKIIYGDKSDNIGSIYGISDLIDGKKIVKKNITELYNDYNSLVTYLKKNKQVYERFLQNKKLIDFDEIPYDINKLNELEIK